MPEKRTYQEPFRLTIPTGEQPQGSVRRLAACHNAWYNAARTKGDLMGLTVLEIRVGNPAAPDVTRPIEFLVDSGAIYSVVPESVLQELNIKPIAEQTFRLADGSKISRKKGVALFRYGDQIGGADVIFGEEGDYTLLGAFTLEALCLAHDPLKRELRPLPMILARQTGPDPGTCRPI